MQEIFLFSGRVQSGCGSHPAFYSNVYWVSFPSNKAAGTWS